MQFHQPTAWLLVIPVALLSARTPSQAGISNGTFEGDRIGAAPAGWFFPKPCADAGYALEVNDVSAASGKCSAALRGTGEDERMFGNCMQSVDAEPFRGKRVRFSASVRCEPADAESRAQLWLRVDRPDEQVGFFDNMDDRRIRSSEWKRYEIIGDIAKDAESIALGMMLIGGGTAMLDDVVLETTDSSATTGVRRAEGVPGLVVTLYEATLDVTRDTEATTIRFPLPLAYRDQTPLTFNLELQPADVEASCRIADGPGLNRVLEVELRNVAVRNDVILRYESIVLVEPSSFDSLPTTAAFPSKWPEDAAPWLSATWCCDSENERIKALGTEIRAKSNDVRSTVKEVLTRSQDIFYASKGRVAQLTATEALDKQGSCTSCANLVTALLRASGIPARILAGYPLWSGPLQTHYIVEAFVPGYGWYPVESTLGRASWPNCQQVNVSIVPIEHEAESLAGRRPCAAGAVPFMTLTEYGTESPIECEGTLKQYCDHEARQVRAIEADAADWRTTQEWARARWSKWLASNLELHAGRVQFGPMHDALSATTLAELRSALP